METPSKIKTYLIFNIGIINLAFPISRVHEIVKMKPIKKLPYMPGYYNGVVNLRNNVLPVIDTRIKFGLYSKDVDENTYIIVLTKDIDNQLLKIGALTDNTPTIKSFSTEKIKPYPSLGTGFDPSYIDGMINFEGEFFLIVNIDNVFYSDYGNFLIDESIHQRLACSC